MKTYQEKRPWGSFERFTHNESSTVKIIRIKKGGMLSLQSHKHRTESWYILKGSPKVQIDKRTVIAKKGDTFFVGKNTKHRLSAPKGMVEILEIAKGKFDENDIKRYEDIYKRN